MSHASVIIQKVASDVATEVELIESGYCYSETALSERIEKFWNSMEDLDSAVVFELVDHFRIAHNACALENGSGIPRDLLLRFHKLLAQKMVESRHREFLARKAFV